MGKSKTCCTSRSKYTRGCRAYNNNDDSSSFIRPRHDKERLSNGSMPLRGGGASTRKVPTRMDQPCPRRPSVYWVRPLVANAPKQASGTSVTEKRQSLRFRSRLLWSVRQVVIRSPTALTLTDPVLPRTRRPHAGNRRPSPSNTGTTFFTVVIMLYDYSIIS